MSIYVSLIDGMGSATDSSGGSVTTTGAKAGDFAHLTNDVIGNEGIVNGLEVSEHSPANMSVDVSAGTCYVLNNGWAANSGDIKYWRVVSDTVENVSIDSNSSGNPRIDIIVVKIDNTVAPNDEATNVATVEVVKGTPASSPSAPATPSNALLLAEVYVADGATSITNADITDRREYFGGKLDHINIIGNKDVVNHSVIPVSDQTLNILEYKDKNGNLDAYMDADGVLHWVHDAYQGGKPVVDEGNTIGRSSAVKLSSDWAVGYNSYTNIPYDTIKWNYGGYANTANNGLTATISGHYIINVGTYIDGLSGSSNIKTVIRINGVSKYNSWGAYNNSSWKTPVASFVVFLNSGDNVNAYVNIDGSGGSPVVKGGNDTFLAMTRVSFTL